MKNRLKPSPGPPAAEKGTARSCELTAEETAALCRGCVLCCSYVSIEVDPPRAAWEYDQWIWALHHRDIQLYVERPERWFLHVTTRCSQLLEDGRCAIHGRHPMLCRDHDPLSCERRLPVGDVRAWFDRAEDLEAWVRRERPKHWARLEAWRKSQGMTTEPAVPDAAGDPASRRPPAAPAPSLARGLAPLTLPAGDVAAAGARSTGRRGLSPSRTSASTRRSG
jgi:hypothetical protein